MSARRPNSAMPRSALRFGAGSFRGMLKREALLNGNSVIGARQSAASTYIYPSICPPGMRLREGASERQLGAHLELALVQLPRGEREPLGGVPRAQRAPARPGAQVAARGKREDLALGGRLVGRPPQRPRAASTRGDTRGTGGLVGARGLVEGLVRELGIGLGVLVLVRERVRVRVRIRVLGI